MFDYEGCSGMTIRCARRLRSICMGTLYNKERNVLGKTVMETQGYLFPGRFGGHVEESYIGDHISRLLPDGYAAHTLRHRFATTAYAATHDLFVVAELLGHESVETTEHYVAMPDGRLREATAAVRLI